MCGRAKALTNSPVHPPVGQDTLTIDIPCSIGSEEDTGLTEEMVLEDENLSGISAPEEPTQGVDSSSS